jgi:DNA-binding response OmpR family regulator
VPEAFSSALKVLVVEDDKELAAFVRTGLEEEGFNVTLSFDGGWLTSG